MLFLLPNQQRQSTEGTNCSAITPRLKPGVLASTEASTPPGTKYLISNTKFVEFLQSSSMAVNSAWWYERGTLAGENTQ